MTVNLAPKTRGTLGVGFVENEKKTLKRAGSTWFLGWLGANPGYSSWIRFVMAQEHFAPALSRA